MNKKQIMILLIFSLLLNLTGCVAPVEATDLMKGIRMGEVTGKAPDEEFRRQEYALTVDLLRSAAAHSEREDLLISPLSLQLALAMTANGAAGQTRQEMEGLLAGQLPLDLLNEYLYTYRTGLPSGENSKLAIANSIWYRDEEERLQVEEGFLQTNGAYYDAQVYKAPFDNGTLEDINSWVEEHTYGMIDQILQEINSDTVMYLINALAFDAKWEKAYNKSDLRQGTFHTYNGEEVQADMMHSTEYYYLENENTTGFIKNYKDGSYAFAALLPKEGTDIYDYVSHLSPETLMELLDHPRAETVQAAMPKFTFDYSLSMNDALRDLGMETAFDSSLADFSSMAHSSQGNIYIGDVLHKTYISVDQEGTKAAAVTKVEIVEECAMISEYTVKLDRPFLFLILDQSSNLPLFIGLVTDPT